MEPSFIVAIDFGTTFTGLAWSSYPYDQDEGIQLWRWTKLNGGKEIKTPTAVLFDEREQFLAFGFEAVDQYIELDDHEKNNYYFFLHFKMELHKERVRILSAFVFKNKNNCKSLVFRPSQI